MKLEKNGNIQNQIHVLLCPTIMNFNNKQIVREVIKLKTERKKERKKP